MGDRPGADCRLGGAHPASGPPRRAPAGCQVLPLFPKGLPLRPAVQGGGARDLLHRADETISPLRVLLVAMAHLHARPRHSYRSQAGIVWRSTNPPLAVA